MNMTTQKIAWIQNGKSWTTELMIECRLPVSNMGGRVIQLQYGQLPDGSWIARATPLQLGKSVRVTEGLTTQEEAESCAVDCAKTAIESVKLVWVYCCKNGESNEAIASAKVYGRDAKGFQVWI